MELTATHQSKNNEDINRDQAPTDEINFFAVHCSFTNKVQLQVRLRLMEKQLSARERIVIQHLFCTEQS